MIKISYDLRDNAFVMDADGLGPRSLAVAAVGIVNGMICEARALYGEQAAEAMTEMIQRMTEAGGYFLTVKGGAEDVSDGA